MGSVYEMMSVAEVCPGYMAIYDGFQSSTGEVKNKSC